MILSFYVARKFLLLFAQVFAGFFALMVAIDMIDEVRKFANPGISLSEALLLAMMNVPQAIYRILPLIMILSAIGLFLSLSRSSELVIVRASGRSGLRFLVAPTLTAFLIGVFAVTVPFGGVSFSSARPVCDLPEPDSPTMPTFSRPTWNDTPRTACTMRCGVRKRTCRSSTISCGASPCVGAGEVVIPSAGPERRATRRRTG